MQCCQEFHFILWANNCIQWSSTCFTDFKWFYLSRNKSSPPLRLWFIVVNMTSPYMPIKAKLFKKRPRLRNIKVHWLCCQNKWAKPAEREGDLTGMEIWSCSCIGVFSDVYTKSSGLPLRPIKVYWKRIHWQTGSKLYFLCLSVIEKFAKTWSALTVF